MKTPPLAFTEDNFVSVIQGNKTETRRLVTIPKLTQELLNQFESFNQEVNGDWVGIIDGDIFGIKSRLQIGDRAYLKEPTQIESFMDERNQCLVQYFWHKSETTKKVLTNQDLNKINERKTGWYSKQNQMFMLKSFARYHVEITDVRIERLLDITEEAAIAEGIKFEDWYSRRYWDYISEDYSCQSPIDSYVSEIEMLHGKAIAQSNAWLWVYKFKFLGENS